MDKKLLADYLRDVVKKVPAVMPLLSDDARALVAIKIINADTELPDIRSRYNSVIVEILTGFFEGGNTTASKNRFNRAANDEFGSAFGLGWVDGGQELPPDEDATDWLNARIQQELGNIATLFEQAKELRKEPDFDFFAWVTARADGYTASLDGVYNAARMFGQKGLLTWNLGATEKHCDTCLKLSKGKPHKAAWYISRNYIPRQPGASMDCGGYHCDCSLTDSEGKEVTI